MSMEVDEVDQVAQVEVGEQSDQDMSQAELVVDENKGMKDEDIMDDDPDDLDYEELEGPEDLEHSTATTARKKPSLKPSTVQEIYAFASVGAVITPEKFSNLLGKYIKEFLGVELKAQSWRHVSKAITRDHLGLVDDTMFQPTTAFDSMFAHGRRVSERFYALNEEDRALLGSGSIEKYVMASELWHDWLSGKPAPKDVVTNAELKNEIVQLRAEVAELKAKLDQGMSHIAELTAVLTALLPSLHPPSA
ncbi:hypothetical protein FRC11_004835 [Ceratobasidium sp. 423]|nr:hypothetical protein FRC11_004835 [Ceratobasidium sp. 423]